MLFRLRGLVGRLFPDRQLFVRANDHVRFLALSRRTQLVLACTGVLLVGWMVAATAFAVAMHRSLDGRDQRLARQRVAYDKLVSDVSAYQDKVTQVTRSLRDRQAYLLGLFETGAGRDTASDGSASEPGGREAVARAALQRQIRQLDGELETMTDMSVALEENLADVRQRLVAAMAERDQVAMARAELWQRLQESQRREKGEAERNLTLRDTLGRTLQQLNLATDERDQIERERDFYRTRYKDLERDVAEGQEQQQNLVYRLAERAGDSIQEAERIVSLTGINPKSMVRTAHAMPATAQGGPFVPLDRKERPLEPLQSAVALLDLQLERWDGLQQLLRAIPFAPPVDAYSVTSTFGPRTDPFTQSMAMHQGLDMSAPRRTTVYVGAPGTVVFASRKDRYGKMIEIDHGMGIVTRYGHLDEMLVKPGDKVGFRTKIGLVGSTGRTSGSHLHYEIVVKGKPLDPQRFLDVGKHLFKEVDVAEAKPAAATKLRSRNSVARN
ncbi:MAG: peptidoglycan DD-metalloendopeptidase family protein [Alphaproteobacteria bacterium]|nr:peptidoglycan DD-metalloendopeptidase family protein [Alphaproteobacteria bacterium]